ncbi:MAG TPA: hypothetical protein VKD22_07930 [Ramlibacter sp.]|nr:hypothetical protein [Ramlibacter sp.]
MSKDLVVLSAVLGTFCVVALVVLLTVNDKHSLVRPPRWPVGNVRALDSHIMEPRVEMCRVVGDGTVSFYVSQSHAQIYAVRGACIGACPCDAQKPVAVADALFCPDPFVMMCDCETDTTVCGNESAHVLLGGDTLHDGRCPCSTSTAA